MEAGSGTVNPQLLLDPLLRHSSLITNSLETVGETRVCPRAAETVTQGRGWWQGGKGGAFLVKKGPCRPCRASAQGKLSMEEK